MNPIDLLLEYFKIELNVIEPGWWMMAARLAVAKIRVTVVTAQSAGRKCV